MQGIGYWQELYHLNKNPQPTNLDVSNLHKLEKDGCARPCHLAQIQEVWNGRVLRSCVMESNMEWDRAYCRNFDSIHELLRKYFFFQPKLLIGELYYVYYMEFLWQHKFCWNAQTFEGKLGESFRFHSSYSFAPIFQLLTHIYCYKL